MFCSRKRPFLYYMPFYHELFFLTKLGSPVQSVELMLIAIFFSKHFSPKKPFKITMVVSSQSINHKSWFFQVIVNIYSSHSTVLQQGIRFNSIILKLSDHEKNMYSIQHQSEVCPFLYFESLFN